MDNYIIKIRVQADSEAYAHHIAEYMIDGDPDAQGDAQVVSVEKEV